MPSAWLGPQTNQCRQTRPFTGPWESCDSIRQEHALVEEWGPKLECAETGATLVDDATIRAIVAEQRHGVSQGGMVAQSSPKQVHRGTGWQSPPKPEDRTRQFAVFDAMVDHMVGSANDTSKLR